MLQPVQTILITGAGSGIGRATAIYFAQQGWNVAVGVRNPAEITGLTECDRLRVFKLDVTESGAPERTVTETIDAFNQLDVIVNNAAFSPPGSFEGLRSEEILQAFNVNVFGAMAMARAVLPHFRQQGSGQIVNIGSGISRTVMPFSVPYASSKSALEAFSKALWYEVTPLGIQVKHAILGAFNTGFGVESRADPTLDPLP